MVLVLKAWRGHEEQLRLGTVRGHGRPLVKVQPQLQLMAQDWRGHAKDLRLGTMKRAYERLLVKPSCSGRPQCIGDASTMGWSPRTAVAVECINLSLDCYRGQSWRSDTSPQDHVWIPDIRRRSCNTEVALETPRCLRFQSCRIDICWGQQLAGSGTSLWERTLL